jgi:DNA-directed RNA polymerase subunit delta
MGKAQVTEKIRETPMVDLAYGILKSSREPMLYREIMKKIAGKKAFKKADIERYIAQLYTEINIDGRFVCVGKSLWGLKHWYSIETATDASIVANVKDDFDAELDDEDLFGGDDDFTDEIDDLENRDDFDDDDNDNEEDSGFSDEDDSEEDEEEEEDY